MQVPHLPPGTIYNQEGPITVKADTFTGAVRGDLFLTPRTWVRDLLDAKAGEVFGMAWIVAFGLATGAGAAVMAGTMVIGALRGHHGLIGGSP